MSKKLLTVSLNIKTALLVFSVLILFGVSSAVVFTISSLSHQANELYKVVNRMNDDIRYKDSRWDLFLLNSDPLLPGGESHYIIANDGFVIERWRPIDGLLDTSNLQHILEFTSPKTVTTPSNEKWRVVSVPLRDHNEEIGAVFVSRHMGEGDNIDIADRRLERDLDWALNNITVQNGQIDVSMLDLRQTQYDTSLKVVDRYNQILAKTNNSNAIERAPTYIDTSYLREFLDGKTPYIYWSKSIPYLVLAEPVQTEQNETVGVIVVARSQQSLLNTIFQYIVVIVVFILILIPLYMFWQRRMTTQEPIRTISFDPQDCKIRVGKQLVDIPEDTHQFHIVSALFSNPSKDWSAEEIAKKFDEESEQHLWRRVYDAMLIVNKKGEPFIGTKLIVIKDKKFLLNPKLLDAILS
ncbi:hypothetical protein KBD81_03895 [Candidatus Woesebacteria bacterium]|nr:hypothetical protein [Candidatus Woesebacteria bacterium]